MKHTLKKRYLLILSFLVCMSLSSQNAKIYIKPDVDFKTITSEFRTWWNYYYVNINLSSDFVPIDSDSNVISKEMFFKNLIKGEFIPIRLVSREKTKDYYKLYKLSSTTNKSITNTIRSNSSKYYEQFKREGTKFPNYEVVDLEGETYNNLNTKGKIVILKCWFINCKPCVAEFPVLNDLEREYRNRNDLLFISLAFDSEKELKEFLAKNPFSYKVASVPKDFFSQKLNVNIYPTHFIIDKEGQIRKVVNKADELISALKLSGL